jgi:hypothetical protein
MVTRQQNFQYINLTIMSFSKSCYIILVLYFAFHTVIERKQKTFLSQCGTKKQKSKKKKRQRITH